MLSLVLSKNVDISLLTVLITVGYSSLFEGMLLAVFIIMMAFIFVACIKFSNCQTCYYF